MDTSEIIALGLLIIAIIAIVGPLLTAFFSGKNVRHQALLDIHKEFRSPEMLSALDGIWKFYRDFKKEHHHLKPDSLNFKKSFKEEYQSIHLLQRDSIANDTLEAEKSLNYKRRYVTHFYVHLASLHKHDILPPEMIFDWWIPSDFDIIKDILIPLQEAASDICEQEHQEITGEELKFSLEPLLEMMYECKEYYEKNKKNQISKYDFYKGKLNYQT
ncbi:MAG TPA: hypothetical protein VMY59_01255 [Candidatus Thermoplasmatota archaeon]|nr:hypothetical protein [Candidatus Thermoplasmatota archaeon]HUU88888.1 hypothetical protein [Candidatus Glassbacteria bacterium]